MSSQHIQGDQNVQIQGVVGSRIEISYNSATRTVPLEPAHVPVATKLPSPARLVRAHSGVVPYVERAGLLTELEAWIGSPAPFAGQVIGGRGGTGKTRLAVELCLKAQESGWLCGFLSRIADPGMLDALVETPIARLVVIDYAETRPEQVELLLPILSAKATSRSPVRVLLLVRDSPDSGGDGASRLAGRVDALDAVLDECEARYLEDAPFGVSERHRLFDSAVPALAERLQGPPASAAAPDLRDRVFESPLMVVIAAYLAAHGEEAPTTREGLLEEVLAHECRYWREGSAEIDADDALLERMVALATLVKAENEAQAAERLRLLPDLRDAPAERRNRLARWVRAQYPGPRWWNPLEPDLVGEHLVARCFTEQPEVLAGAIAGEEPDEITRPLEVLGRAAADHPDLASALSPILNKKLTGLCEIAIAQAEAVMDGDLLFGSAVTAAAAIDGVVSVVPVNVESLPAVVDLMPPRANLVLYELATTLTAQLAKSLRPLAEADPDVFASDLASALNNLSNRLADAGRWTEALEASEEAVEIRRPLAEADPATYAPNLAMALSNFSIRLGGAGRLTEALEAIEESVETYRPLTEADPATYAPNLASALNNLSNRLADAGRWAEALEAIEESVEIRRPLAEADPAVFGPNLAMALNNLSNGLARAGRLTEALEASEESVEIRRPLAKAHPAAYAHDLASALNNLSNRLASVGRWAEALEASEESVDIRRPLAEANPAVHAPNLAKALSNFSIRLAGAGRLAEALEAGEKSIEAYRGLAEDNQAVFAPDLAMALHNFSINLSNAGRLAEALEASEEAIGTYRKLTENNQAVFASDLAGALNNFSSRLAEAGRGAEALEASEEAIGTYRKLTEADPVAYVPDLASALNNLSNRLAEAGRGAEALEAIEESSEAYRKLAEANPVVYAPNLAGVLGNLSSRLAEAGRSAEALEASEEAVEIRRPLAEANPAVFAPQLARNLNIHADRLGEAGRDEKAEDARREAAEYLEPPDADAT